MRNLHLKGFERLLDTRPNGATFVALMMRTDPVENGRMRTGRKKEGSYPNPFVNDDKTSRIEKLTLANVIIGSSYENGVNNQREREGHEEHFTAESLWNGAGERVNRYVVRHKPSGRLYLAVRYNNEDSETPRIISTRYQWKATGTPLTDEEMAELQPWLKEDSKPKAQETERTIFWNTVKLSNLEFLRIDGRDYTLEIEQPAKAA